MISFENATRTIFDQGPGIGNDLSFVSINDTHVIRDLVLSDWLNKG